MPQDQYPSDPQRRREGLEMMSKVYGWEASDGPGDFFGMTVEHLFGEVWTREGLSMRDRRLLLVGFMVGAGLDDVLPLQLGAALGNEELTDDELREITVFLTHYCGWPRGAKVNTAAEKAIAAAAKERDQARERRSQEQQQQQ
ncbi:MAG TPA: carboxymuconolactone decarboxylase family protein [Microthrixaceae bacterium]|nr:carboxymuconolactone decarboxylase family protein [Microthrixaceae bacterium]